jgi:transmembrane sensor
VSDQTQDALADANWLQLARYLEGELSPAKEAEVRAWLDENPVRMERFAQLAGAWRSTEPGTAEPVWDSDQGAQSVLARIARGNREATLPTDADTRGLSRMNGSLPQRAIDRSERAGMTSAVASIVQHRGRAHARWGMLGLAAVIAIGAILGRNGGRKESPITPKVYMTGAGQIATVEPVSGTRVVLGPATSIAVTGIGATAHITVDGQALFTVAPHARRTLVVHAGRTQSRVLGTRFLVRRYQRDAATTVAVFEGRVMVGDTIAPHASPVILTAGMSGVTTDSGAIVLHRSVLEDEYLAWTRGALVFRRVPVREIAAELSRAYGVVIQVPDSTLGAQCITWTVHTTRNTLSDVLDDLSLVLDVRVIRQKEVVLLVPGRAITHPATRTQLLRGESRYGR